MHFAIIYCISYNSLLPDYQILTKYSFRIHRTRKNPDCTCCHSNLSDTVYRNHPQVRLLGHTLFWRSRHYGQEGRAGTFVCICYQMDVEIMTIYFWKIYSVIIIDTLCSNIKFQSMYSPHSVSTVAPSSCVIKLFWHAVHS